MKERPRSLLWEKEKQLMKQLNLHVSSRKGVRWFSQQPLLELS